MRAFLRRFINGATLLLLSLSALPGAPASAQTPAVAEPYVLTDAIVVNFIASFAEIKATADIYLKQHNIPTGQDPATTLAAFAPYPDALSALNGLAVRYGFPDISDWVDAYVTILSAMFVADPTLTAQDRAMLVAMMPALNMLEGNVSLVANHYAELMAVLGGPLTGAGG